MDGIAAVNRDLDSYEGKCYGSFPKSCAKGFGGTSTRLASALPLLPASALLMASVAIARQQLVTGGSKAISESLSAAAHLRSGVTTEGGSVTHPLASAHQRAWSLWTPCAS